MRASIISTLACCLLVGVALSCGDTTTDGPDAAHSTLSRRYLDSTLSVDDRVADLLAQMTTEEKLWQLLALPQEPLDEPSAAPGDASLTELMQQRLSQARSGLISGALNNVSLEQGVDLVRGLQERAAALCRFGIPLLVIEECLHGLVADGATSFPVPLALASTWDPDLVQQVAAAIGSEAHSRGVHMALSPTVNLARDPRNGRTEETYGEDPWLASRLAVAFVRGLQSQGVAATLKHFVANFAADGGRDSHAVHISERLLREVYFPPFEAAIREGGALCVMAAYNSLDGVPCHANPWLLRDVLKAEWGLPGFVVSDYTGVPGLFRRHSVAPDLAAAAALALDSGVDVELPTSNATRQLTPSIGQLDPGVLDEAVARVLSVKLQLGLFEQTPVDHGRAVAAVSAEHRALARSAAQRSIVLLKNEDAALPLPRDLKTLAVLGPNAAQGQLGGYSASGVSVVSPLEGVQAALASQTDVLYAPGCVVSGVSEGDKSRKLRPMLIDAADARGGLAEAVELAARADAVLLFAGNTSETEGEGMDRSDLALPGVQVELIQAVCAVNDRVVVVLINGSAVTMQGWIDDVEAVLEAWYPGQEGGHAVADVLFGDVNPSGKLPLTYPLRTGQLPLSYNARPGGRAIDDYVDLRGEQPLFPFGHGLSYTTFRYADLRITSTEPSSVRVRCELTNVGDRPGAEVVQLYLHQQLGEVVPRRLELRGFQRVMLLPGETRTVEFELSAEDFSILDARLHRVHGRGPYDVLLGASSTDIRVTGEIER